MGRDKKDQTRDREDTTVGKGMKSNLSSRHLLFVVKATRLPLSSSPVPHPGSSPFLTSYPPAPLPFDDLSLAYAKFPS